MEDNSKVVTKHSIVKLLTSIRKIKSTIAEINITKDKLIMKKNTLSATLEKTRNVMQQINQDFSEYKELLSYTIDIDYYIKKYRYMSVDINISEIHNKFKNPKFTDSNICMSTIKSYYKFINSVQKVRIYKNNLNKITKTNTAELALYNTELYKKSLNEYYNELKKIDKEIDDEKTERYEIYKQIINEIIDGKIVRNIPFYNTKIHTARKNIISQIECTKQYIKSNNLKQTELKRRIIEYTNTIENDIYNVQETLFNNIISSRLSSPSGRIISPRLSSPSGRIRSSRLSSPSGRIIIDVSVYFSVEKYTILIESLDKKYSTLVSKLEIINTQLTNLSLEFNKLFDRMVDILQRMTLSQIHIWNSAINEFNA